MNQTSMQKLALFFFAEFHREELHVVEVELLHRFLPISLSALWKNNYGLPESELRVSCARNIALDRAINEFHSGPSAFLFAVEVGKPNLESYFFSSSAQAQIDELIENAEVSAEEGRALQDASDALFVTYHTELNLRSSKERCKAS